MSHSSACGDGCPLHVPNHDSSPAGNSQNQCTTRKTSDCELAAHKNERDVKTDLDLTDFHHHTFELNTLPRDHLELNKQYGPTEKSEDAESGQVGEVGEFQKGSKSQPKRPISDFYGKYRVGFHLTIWMLWTAWWIYGVVKHRHDLGWLIPFLLYLAITIRIVTLWIPTSLLMRPVRLIWRSSVGVAYEKTPAKFRKPIAAALTLAIFLIGSFVPADTGYNTRASRAISLFGLAFMLVAMWLTSHNRSRIPWHTVIGGLLAQFIIAVFVLKTNVGYDIFKFISDLARSLLGFASQGTAFLTDDYVAGLKSPATSATTWFLVTVIPAIVFFVSLVSLWYHLGILQWLVTKFATFFFWALHVSGAEAVVASATPFIGQGESAMLIRPFIPHLTRAELHHVMTCGFATIAGSVLVVYIGMGLDSQALVSSCVMSIPASIALSKMRYPEEEPETLTSGNVVVPEEAEENRSANALHAFANGAWLGLKIAGMICANLLCIIAFVGLANGLLTWWGRYWGIEKLTLELILGYVMYPVAWLLGVPKQDLRAVGEVIGLKVITNEFYAFNSIAKNTEMTDRGKLIATYACCGFGNLGSLGNQIGVLSQISPGRSGDISRVAVSALITGVIATLSSASIAGMLYTERIDS